MKEKILVSAFASILVFASLNGVQYNATELQDSNIDNASIKEVKTVDNSKYGWSHGAVGACDQNNYDIYYSQNTAAGGYTYQNAWIDSDVYSKVSVTKNKATAKAERGAKYSYNYGHRDYN